MSLCSTTRRCSGTFTVTLPPLVSTSMPRKMQARAGSSRFDFFLRRPGFVSALDTTAISSRHLAAEGQDNMQSSTYHAIEHITPPPVSI
jgi:hypothetical protein